MVDTSLLVDVLLETEGTAPVRRRLFRDGQSLCAPSLIRLETLEVLRKLTRAGRITEAAAHLAFVAFVRAPIYFYTEDVLIRRIRNLRHNLTTYDAAFVALAEVLNAPLLTRDERLAAVTGTRATIELVQLAAAA